MSCTYDIPIEVQDQGTELVRGDSAATQEVGAFLIALQDYPLPKGRQLVDPDVPNAFWIKLNCGIYISWAIVADPNDWMKLFAGRVSPNIVIKVLGFGRDVPAGK
ncbi:MAG: hypothetical protein WBA18_21125 [Terracidiphilus sp.]